MGSDRRPGQRWSRAAFILAGLLVAFAHTPGARAQDCGVVGGVIVGNECQVSAPSPVVSGVLTFDQTLHLLPGGSINAAPGVIPPPLTINITSGDLLMDNNSLISGGGTVCAGRIRETAPRSPSP